MLNQQTITKLHELKLTGMAEAFADQTKQPDMDRLSFAERFGPSARLTPNLLWPLLTSANPSKSLTESLVAIDRLADLPG